MSGPKIVAALFGAGVLLTLAWNYAAEAILSPGMQQAAGNVEALSASRDAEAPIVPAAEDRVQPLPRGEGGKPPRTVGGKPSGWHVDESWTHSADSNTSRNAGP